MPRSTSLAALIIALVISFAGAAAAEDRSAFEQRITAELAAQSPEAVNVFRRANEARDRRDFDAALGLYRKVHELAPTFSTALRRACGIETMRGHRDDALALCGQALELERTAYNLAANASALVMKPHTGDEAQRASRQVQEAIHFLPDEANIRLSACEVALATNDFALLRESSRRLDTLAPDEIPTHVFAAILATSEGRFDDAHAAVARARAHGMPEDAARKLDDDIDRATPLTTRVLGTGWKVLVGWLGGFALLLAIGFALSRATLAASRRVPTTPDGRARGFDARLRAVYRAVLWATCAYYYLSLPLVILAVVGAGGGLLLGILSIGVIPIKLVLIIAVVVFVTVGAVLKSIFVRGTDSDPGLRLDLAEHPDLAAVLHEVAEKVGTRPVDTVFLTPGTDMAVTERGGMRGLLRGGGERCLIVGAGVLRGMKVLELKSILAHEHGHFKNEDTAGGGFALAVRRSLFNMALGLARGGAAAWYNPAWWFVRGFDRVFLVISHGASRLQEVLADRWAAFAYGSEAFEKGMRHVIGRSLRFDAHVDATLKEVLTEKRPLLNLYSYKPSEKSDVSDKLEEVLSAAPSAYDSHPSPADRIAWVRALAAPAPEPRPDDAMRAWKLFAGREALEQEMTDVVRANILAAHGVAIPKRGDEEEDEEEEAGEG